MLCACLPSSCNISHLNPDFIVCDEPALLYVNQLFPKSGRSAAIQEIGQPCVGQLQCVPCRHLTLNAGADGFGQDLLVGFIAAGLLLEKAMR